jgi:hypothetical protein
MKNKIIIIIVIFVIVVVAAVWKFLPLGGSSGTSGKPAANNAQAVNGIVKSMAPQMTSTLPPNTPQGSTIVLGNTRGTVSVKNFYKTAKGYIPSVDAIVLEDNASYTIWYYRSNGYFDIWFAPSAGTSADEAAATEALENDLGIDQEMLCTLSVETVFQIDQGITNQTDSLKACASGAF